MSKGNAAVQERLNKTPPQTGEQRKQVILAAADALMKLAAPWGLSSEQEVLGWASKKMIRRVRWLGRHPVMSQVIWQSPVEVMHGHCSALDIVPSYFTTQILLAWIDVGESIPALDSYSFRIPDKKFGRDDDQVLTVRHHVTPPGAEDSWETSFSRIIVPAKTSVNEGTRVSNSPWPYGVQGFQGATLGYSGYLFGRPDLEVGSTAPVALGLKMQLGVIGLGALQFDPRNN
ncbi:MAG TPA: hypothetical protein VLG47_02595 [Candidatus Saccharimonadales bacterium]|nr:hypothetical protein [Candidatus Saccharimonadales bacterium]